MTEDWDRRYVIRLADLDDAEELARLRWDFSREEGARGDQSSDQYVGEFREFFANGLAEGRWTVVVAEVDSGLVANAWLEVVDVVPWPDRSSKKWGYVTNVYTEPGFRGAGIGSKILGVVVQGAQLLKCELLIVWPSEESVGFYQRAGFSPNPMLLELNLDQTPATKTRRVVVSEYDPNWPRMFEEERRQIQGAIGERVVAIEHVGSTAVPGLGAKPIIDIMLGVSRLSDFKKCIVPLEKIGYEHAPWADVDMPGRRRYFRKSIEGVRSHHLHMCEFGGEFWGRHVTFRDYLRNKPQEARRYLELKKELAAKFEWDTIGYTEAKTAFVEAALASTV